MTRVRPRKEHPMDAISNATSDRLSQYQDLVKSRIDKRLTALTKAQDSVTHDANLSDAQKSALLNEISNDVTTLQNLETKVEGDTKISDVTADRESMHALHVMAYERPKVKDAVRLA